MSRTHAQKTDRAVRALEEPCHFCGERTVILWRDMADYHYPFQVRCSCGAAGPRCDCGEESAIPAWLSVKPASAD